MKTFDKKFWWIFLLFLGFIALILFLPYFFTQNGVLDFTQSGQIGDTIGGILGPFIAIGAAVLTFLAFWVQYKANEQQKADLQYERFETRFFQLLALHQHNVAEIKIRDRSGRKAFISMFNELKYLHSFVEQEYKHLSSIEREPLTATIRYNIAYLIFLYGCKGQSVEIVLDTFKNQHSDFIKLVSGKLEVLADCEVGTVLSIERNSKTYNFYTKYKPFFGHLSKLGHYFRHVYQIVIYVDSNSAVDEFDHRYEYIKILRAQLSSHEQLMLYYYSLSGFGREWLQPVPEGEFLLKKYCLVQNLLIALADFFRKPVEVFGNEKENFKGIKLFEQDLFFDHLNW